MPENNKVRQFCIRKRIGVIYHVPPHSLKNNNRSNAAK